MAGSGENEIFFSRGQGPEVDWIRASGDVHVIKFQSPGTFAIRIRDGKHFDPWHVAWGDNGMVQAQPSQQREFSQMFDESQEKREASQRIDCF